MEMWYAWEFLKKYEDSTSFRCHIVDESGNLAKHEEHDVYSCWMKILKSESDNVVKMCEPNHVFVIK